MKKDSRFKVTLKEGSPLLDREGRPVITRIE